MMNNLRNRILKLARVYTWGAVTLAFALLASAGTAFAQGAPITGLAPWFAGPTGAPKAGAIITICNYPSVNIPCTNYANVYSDIGLTVLINQVTHPITTDGLGNVPTVYVAPGTYAATVSGTGITSPQGPYVFGISCIAGSSCVANPDPSLLTLNGGLTSSQPITSTVATGTPPLVIASTTNIPHLNASLLNGLTPPASATGLGSTVYNTLISETTASVPSTLMATAPASDTNYLFTVSISQTVATSGCSVQPAILVTVSYTDAASGSNHSFDVAIASGVLTYSLNQNLESIAPTAVSLFSGSWQIRAKASTTISYAVAYTPGTGCSNGGTYVTAPVLMQQ